ncbi:hypothetical protein [Natrinema amylolyticum]|uniref:hypothetical protein n=1 Tax=Natrinema amylolyticum TaxID=2878679 RepID=UPI001CF9D57B|nr:hypothetical protein [Natrinema amylolyticum]
MVREAVVSEIKSVLEGPVSIDCERRGFERRRGVPDSVFWVKPADDRFEYRLLPILVELEGTFANALDDFSKFANRYDDTDYQYSVEAPVIGDSAPDRCLKRMKYDVIGIRANSITDDHDIKEEKMHDALSSWFDRFKANIQTRVSVIRHLPQKVIEWHLSFTMFGHNFETVVPFIFSERESVSDETIERLTVPSLPGIVVVNNKYDSRDHTELQHKTAIEFSAIHPIRFR